MKKRMLSIMLAICMVLTLVPTTVFAESDILLGDVNCDGNINAQDFVLLNNYLCGRSGVTISDIGPKNSDVNRDGNINVFDYMLLYNHLLGMIDLNNVDAGTPQTNIPPKTISSSAGSNDSIRINATSNYFPSALTIVDEVGGYVTVTYFIGRNMDMNDLQWSLIYDRAFLEFDESDNKKDDGTMNLMPLLNSRFYWNIVNGENENKIKVIASTDINDAFSFVGKGLVPFVTATFKIIGPGETEVHLYVECLTPSGIDKKAVNSGAVNAEISHPTRMTAVYKGNYDFTDDITKPVISNLENNKTYCDAVEFEVTDNVGVASVQAGDKILTPGTNGKYTLEKGKGNVKVVATDFAGNTADVTVTVNNGHTANDDGDCTTEVTCECGATVKPAETTHKWGIWTQNVGEDTHTRSCKNAGCNRKETEPCTGGTATCQAKAICTDCKGSYGEKDPANHTQPLSDEWLKNNSGHWKIHPCCPDVKVGEESHTGSDDGNCTTPVICECGETVKSATTHNWSNWTQNVGEDTHTRSCQNAGCNGKETEPCTGGTATCKKKAICEYCKKEYGELNFTNHDLENIPAKESSVTDTGNTEYWHCKDCENNFSDPDGKNSIPLEDTVIAKLPPAIIEGMGQSITAGERKTLAFRSNAAFGDFIRVEFDGKTLDKKNYTAKEGSTVVTLKADYVAKLSTGKHTIGIVSESGTATTTFTVNEKAWKNTVLRLQSSVSKTSVKLKWNAVPEADGYVIYWNRCGAKSAYKPIKTVKTLTWTHKNLKKNSQNRYMVKAYKVIDGKKTFIKTSNPVHLVTKGGKYTNVKKLKSSVSSITLKNGRRKH